MPSSTNSPSSDPPSISWPLDRPTHRSPWDPQTEHAHEHAHANGHFAPSAPPPDRTPQTELQYPLPPNTSLSGISLRSHLLGLTLGISLSSTLLLLSSTPTCNHYSPLWRLPFFLSTLSTFHFLEYFTTARYNPSAASPSAFLLSQNGSAYNIAHALAFIESALWNTLLKPYVAPSHSLHIPLLSIGLFMVVLGQAIRTVAMAQAGRNFNHIVQSNRKVGHELVKGGVYKWLRHPSYFGFFWWGLGTQVVLGNGLCFVGYAVVLWRFFKGRIEKEEELLVKFFGQEYIEYRARTWVGIPFIL